MTRTVYFKEAGEEERRIYALVKAANQAGIDAVRPGVPLRDIDGRPGGSSRRAATAPTSPTGWATASAWNATSPRTSAPARTR